MFLACLASSPDLHFYSASFQGQFKSLLTQSRRVLSLIPKRHLSKGTTECFLTYVKKGIEEWEHLQGRHLLGKKSLPLRWRLLGLLGHSFGRVVSDMVEDGKRRKGR